MKEIHTLWLFEAEAKEEKNPCRRRFGPGPTDKKCKDCSHLFKRELSKNYYKCSFRKETRGPGSDHRVRWKACGKFEEYRGGK